MADYSNNPLTHYNWKYTFEPNVIGTVAFSETGQLFLQAGPGSNSMGGSWRPTENPNIISTGHSRTTLMLPPPEVQARESLFSKTFSNKEKLEFDLDSANPDSPILTIGEEKLKLTGILDPKRRWNVDPIRKFYDVYPDESSPSKFKMREVTYDDNYVKTTFGEWKPYPVGYIEDMKYPLDGKLELRIRVNEYIVDGVTKQCVFDMVVQSKVV
jgi:hypothetical protein